MRIQKLEWLWEPIRWLNGQPCDLTSPPTASEVSRPRLLQGVLLSQELHKLVCQHFGLELASGGSVNCLPRGWPHRPADECMHPIESHGKWFRSRYVSDSMMHRTCRPVLRPTRRPQSTDYVSKTQTESKHLSKCGRWDPHLRQRSIVRQSVAFGFRGCEFQRPERFGPSTCGNLSREYTLPLRAPLVAFLHPTLRKPLSSSHLELTMVSHT